MVIIKANIFDWVGIVENSKLRGRDRRLGDLWDAGTREVKKLKSGVFLRSSRTHETISVSVTKVKPFSLFLSYFVFDRCIKSLRSEINFSYLKKQRVHLVLERSNANWCSRLCQVGEATLLTHLNWSRSIAHSWFGVTMLPIDET